MKIVIINGSQRKNGATYNILNELHLELQKFQDAEIEFYNVSELELKYCIGCCKCYKFGRCVFNDDMEKLSRTISTADGIIIGSPTYASNVSAQVKTIIDRGHFVIEQLLYQKYAISVATYENYGGKDTSEILNKLLSYSGANISGKIVCKTPFSHNPIHNIKFRNYLIKVAKKFHKDIQKKRKYILQSIKRNLILKFGILPFVKRKGDDYSGVIFSYKEKHIL